MKFCTIGSGSKGNMTYIETEQTKVIVDAGISLRDAQRRTIDHGIDFANLDAIIITHEHIDHVKFLANILKKTKATLYINQLSFNKIHENIKDKLVDINIKYIEANKRYKIKDLDFLTLKLSHDSANVFGFIFISDEKRLAYITDTGFFPLQYVDILKNVDAIIIESNHDIGMLLESDRPRMLKERILSPYGHMSNYICQQLLINILNERHKIVILAHISQECNSTEVIENEVIQEIKKVFNVDILVALQCEALKLCQI